MGEHTVRWQAMKGSSFRGMFLTLAMTLACAAAAQTAPTPADTSEKAPDAKSPDSSDSAAKAQPAPAKTAVSAQEAERQAKIVADTDKLCQLIQELKVEVAKSSKDTLSLSVIKKAAEIEKLAKSLKERMRPQ
jgi:hypothetical protein